MKTSYLLQSKKKRHPIRFALYGAAAGLCVALFLFDGLVQQLVAYGLVPVVGVREYVVRTVYPFSSSLFRSQSEQDEYERTKRALQVLQAENDSLRSAMFEINDFTDPFLLQDTLATSSATVEQQATTSTTTKVLQEFPVTEHSPIQNTTIIQDIFDAYGTVITKPPYSPFDRITAIVDILREETEYIVSETGYFVGKKIYVSVSDPQQSSGVSFVPIGSVTSQAGNVIVADIFSAADNEVLVNIGTSSVTHTARGKGAGVFEIDIPKGLGVSVGDAVYLNQYTQHPFAFVHHISDNSSSPQVYVTFLLPKSLFELDVIYIEK